MSTLVVKPDAHPEVTSVDGFVEHDCVTAYKTWANLVIATGTFADDDGASLTNLSLAYFYTGGAPSGLWRGLYRGIILFDLSLLLSNDTINSAVISLYGSWKTDGLGVLPDINIYSANPASNIGLAAGDFDAVGSTPFSTAIPYANWVNGSYNHFTLNAQGLANLTSGGIAKFSVRNANYDVSGIAPAWTGNAASGISWYQADKGTDYAPKLTIDYTRIVNRLNTIKDIITLEAIRNVEMSAMGRFYINEEGKATYESRYARNP